MEYIYHYHLSYGVCGGVADIDGIATMKKEILTMDDYRDFKKLAEPINWEVATVKSLSLLKIKTLKWYHLKQ